MAAPVTNADMLNTVLDQLRQPQAKHVRDSLPSKTYQLLTTLQNPLNIAILVSHFLSSRALWADDGTLAMSTITMQLFSSAARRTRQKLRERMETPALLGSRDIKPDDWAVAVLRGLSDETQSWQHALVCAGMLTGAKSPEEELPSFLPQPSRLIEEAMVSAVNASLDGRAQQTPTSQASVVLAISVGMQSMFPFLHPPYDCDKLLPVILNVMTGKHGYDGCRFIGQLTVEIGTEAPPPLPISWPETSPSFRTLSDLTSEPLVARMGLVSNMAVKCVEFASDPGTIMNSLDILAHFTKRVHKSWRWNPLANIDPYLESQSLTPDTLNSTWPVLGDLFKKLLFSVVAILHAIQSRAVIDPALGSNRAIAPVLGTKTLHILKDLSFISMRHGNSAFEIYTFTQLAAVEILHLKANPEIANPILIDLLPQTFAWLKSPAQLLEDTFFFTIAELFAIAGAPPNAAESFIMGPAKEYINSPHTPSKLLHETFESANAAVISVIIQPANAQISLDFLPYYTDKLFESFPTRISPRQFRLAFRTIVQIVSPPYPIAGAQPQLCEHVLEMARMRSEDASQAVLEPLHEPSTAHREPPMSEQTTFIMAIIDALPFISHSAVLTAWLHVTVRALTQINDHDLRETARERFWEVMHSGEMDVERSLVTVRWWATRGGRELFFASELPDRFIMSGALNSDSDSVASRL